MPPQPSWLRGVREPRGLHVAGEDMRGVEVHTSVLCFPLQTSAVVVWAGLATKTNPQPGIESSMLYRLS